MQPGYALSFVCAKKTCPYTGKVTHHGTIDLITLQHHSDAWWVLLGYVRQSMGSQGKTSFNASKWSSGGESMAKARTISKIVTYCDYGAAWYTADLLGLLKLRAVPKLEAYSQLITRVISTVLLTLTWKMRNKGGPPEKSHGEQHLPLHSWTFVAANGEGISNVSERERNEKTTSRCQWLQLFQNSESWHSSHTCKAQQQW